MRHLCVILTICLVAGCHDDPPVVYPTSSAIKIDTSKLPLGVGDKLNLTVWYGSKKIESPYTLDQSGKIAVQFIGPVDAVGKTVDQVAEDIKAKLSDGYLVEPIVQLTIAEINSLTLSVSGMVLKTGSIKFTPNMTIVDVIAQSGGFTPMARKNMVKVIRTVDGKKETYKLPVEKMSEGERPNFSMMPGDEVFVPERPW